MVSQIDNRAVIYRSQGLDPDPAPLDAGIVDGDPQNLFAAGCHIRDVDPQHLQPIFQLFQGEVVLVQHE